MNRKQSEIEHWSKKFLDASENSDEFQKIWYNKHKLDTFEQYMVMSILRDFRTYSVLLRSTLDQPDPQKLPFYKRIFKK